VGEARVKVLTTEGEVLTIYGPWVPTFETIDQIYLDPGAVSEVNAIIVL
jgi:hypothetical protein